MLLNLDFPHNNFSRLQLTFERLLFFMYDFLIFIIPNKYNWFDAPCKTISSIE